ncbi:hypothetical protein [Helicobacter sp. L8]|uniref:hypothetical protein n=1 Tax=Helicobacter sp. L8 TaxID=2316078 RepID=UPI000EB28402|nr:hypothetical protein [Helicobacter sp. L8]
MLKMGVFGALSVLLFSCAQGAPKWVSQCAKPATLQENKVVACGVATILEGDVDNALSVAGARARAKLADFLSGDQNRQQVHVELRATKIQAEWISQDRAYALVDVHASNAKTLPPVSKDTPATQDNTKKPQEKL